MKGFTCLLLVSIAIVSVSLFTGPSVSKAADYQIQVDASQQLGPWLRFYETCVGTGRYHTWVDSGYGRTQQGAGYRAHHEAGFGYVRGHDTFNDSIGLYDEDASGNPVYNWTTFDQINDAILAQGLRPFMEFSYIPRKLACLPDSKNQYFWYNGYGMYNSPPDDYNTWKNFIKAIIEHLEARYGAEEVRQWYFEVWNEPDLGDFFAPCFGWGNWLNEYYDLYDYASEGVREADPFCRVGGPSTSATNPTAIESFLNHCFNEVNRCTGQVGSKLDFITYHRYPDDITFRSAIRMDSSPVNFRNYHNEIMAMVSPYDFTGEIFVTEFATRGAAGDPHSSNENPCSFVAKTVHMLMENTVPPPDGLSYWTISDIFEEWDARPNTAYDGGFGMLLRGTQAIADSHDVAKPLFNAYQLMHRMGDQKLAVTGGTWDDGVNACATSSMQHDGSEQVQILLYSHQDGGSGDPYYSDHVTITVNNLPFAGQTVHVEHQAVDVNHSNSYRVWNQMGRPTQPDAGQWATIKDAANIDDMFPPEDITISGGTFTRSFDVRRYGVYLITLTGQACDSPSGLTATASSGEPLAVHLTWNDPYTGGDCDETGFVIERRPYLGNDTWAEVGTAPHNATDYTDTEHLFGNVEYRYRVGAMR